MKLKFVTAICCLFMTTGIFTSQAQQEGRYHQDEDSYNYRDDSRRQYNDRHEYDRRQDYYDRYHRNHDRHYRHDGRRNQGYYAQRRNWQRRGNNFCSPPPPVHMHRRYHRNRHVHHPIIHPRRHW